MKAKKAARKPAAKANHAKPKKTAPGKKPDVETSAETDKGREGAKDGNPAAASGLISSAEKISQRPMSEWIMGAYAMMTERGKVKFRNMPGMWDELTLNEKLNPEDGKMLRTLIGYAIRTGVWNLVGWAKAAPLPEVQDWADSLLADVVMCLDRSGYVKAKGIEKHSEAFQTRWKQLKKDGRGGSDLAVVPLFAKQVMRQAELLLEHIMRTAPDGDVDLSDIPSKAERELWRFVTNFQQMMDATGQRFDEPDFIRCAFAVLLCAHKTEQRVLDSILMPLAAEMWPQFIREPGIIEFTGWGRFKFGKPLSSRVNKSKHGKPITDFGTLGEQIRPAIQSEMRFRRLLGGDSTVPLVKQVSPTKTKS